MLGKELGDLSQDAGLVGDVQANVVTRGGRIDGQRGNVARGGFGTSGTAQDQAPGC